jgi:hypothetical protein
MIKSFKNHWKEMSKCLDVDIQDEKEGEAHYFDMAQETENMYDKQTLANMALDEARHRDQLKNIKRNKEEREKNLMPAMEATKSSDKNNPWAICHAQGLEGDKFESCVMDLKDKFGIAKDSTEENYKKMGIEGAGQTPNSLLAEQDLEDETETKTKGQVEQTGKKLDAITDKAEDATSTEEKDTLIDKLKANQIKRQKAIINAREKESTKKSFKDFWSGK